MVGRTNTATDHLIPLPSTLNSLSRVDSSTMATSTNPTTGPLRPYMLASWRAAICLSAKRRLRSSPSITKRQCQLLYWEPKPGRAADFGRPNCTPNHTQGRRDIPTVGPLSKTLCEMAAFTGSLTNAENSVKTAQRSSAVSQGHSDLGVGRELGFFPDNRPAF